MPDLYTRRLLVTLTIVGTIDVNLTVEDIEDMTVELEEVVAERAQVLLGGATVQSDWDAKGA